MEKPELTDFCGRKDEIRNHLQALISVDGYTIASNGHVMAFRKGEEGAPPPESYFSRFASLIDQFPVDGWSALDKKEFTESICGECGGTCKVLSVGCPECDGEGKAIAGNDYNEYEVECRTCEGEGNITQHGDLDGDDCHYCDDGKQIKTGGEHSPQGVTIQNKYYAQLQELPGIEVARAGEKMLLAFRCKDFSGFVMGFRN